MITVIIPSANRLNILKKVISSYKNPLVNEIIIINDSIDQCYNELISDEVRVINTSGRIGAPASRNLGILNSKNNILLFGEDDAFLNSNYIRTLYREILKYPRNIYSGILCNLLSNENIIDAETRINNFSFLESSSYFDYKLLRISVDYRLKNMLSVPLTHALFMFNKEVYKDLKFYEDYSKVIGYREETDLQASIRKLGGYIYVIPETYVMHMSRLDVNTGGQRTSKLKFLYYSTFDNYKFLIRHKSLFCRNSTVVAFLKSMYFPVFLIINKFLK